MYCDAKGLVRCRRCTAECAVQCRECSTMQRVQYNAESAVQCRECSTMQRVQYNAESAVQCRECSTLQGVQCNAEVQRSVCNAVPHRQQAVLPPGVDANSHHWRPKGEASSPFGGVKCAPSFSHPALFGFSAAMD